MSALPIVLHWHSILSYTLDSWFVLLCSITPPIHRDLFSSFQRCCLWQEGPWPPSGGEALCAGSFTSLPGLISSCQVTVPKLSNGLLLWRQKCSRITWKVSWTYACFPEVLQLGSPTSKKLVIYPICLHVICPWDKIPFLSQFSKHCSFAGLLLPFWFTAGLFIWGEKREMFPVWEWSSNIGFI